MTSRLRTVREIHAISRRIGKSRISREEARSIIRQVSDDPQLDISAHRSHSVTASDVRRELALAAGIDEDDLLYPRPEHYRSNTSGIEVIDIARHLGFSLGNVVKFIGRAGEESGVLVDLEKAMFYLDDAAEHPETIPEVDWNLLGIDIDAYLDGQQKVGSYGQGNQVYRLVTTAQRVATRSVDPGRGLDYRIDRIKQARQMISEAIEILAGSHQQRFQLHVDPRVVEDSAAADFFSEIAKRPDVSVTYLPDSTPQLCAMLIASSSEAQRNIWIAPFDPAPILAQEFSEDERRNILPFCVDEDFQATAAALRGILR